MAELRLLFNKAAANGEYTVQVVPSSGNATDPLTFKPFLTDDDYEDLRWYLEDFMDLPDGGSVVRAKRIERSLNDWGQRLFAAAFSTESSRKLLGDLWRFDGAQTLTIATSDTDILRLPWELLADADGPFCRQGLSIRRQLRDAAESKHRMTKLPLRILLVVSRPTDLGFIDPRLTSASLLDALKPLGDNVVVDFCRPPTMARLEEMLIAARNDPYDIVHFDGHGTFLPDIELGALCFEMPDDKATIGGSHTDHVRADRLGKVLSSHHVPLVILEACRSGQVGKVAMFRAVAPRLIKAGVGSVISMSHAVHVEAAHIFLEHLYREIVVGATMGQAIERGRVMLIERPVRWLELGPSARTVELQDWFLPNLYQRGDDQPILPPAPPPPDRFDVFLSHSNASDADAARIERIALLLKNRHGLRVWLDKWEIGRGLLHEQCVEGVSKSHVTLIACTNKAMESGWVTNEKNWAFAAGRTGKDILPLLLEELELPLDLKALTRVDFLDPAKDADQVAEVARLVGPPLDSSTKRQACRAPASGQEVGAFPHPPRYGFQGRARELYDLERQLRGHRAILLHAMGGMGKTTLAAEAAFWWTRTGLFPDGACFISFEQPAGVERVIQVLGTYLEGNDFNALPAAQQRSRAKELFQQRQVLMVWDNFESVLPAFQNGQGPGLYSDDERNQLYGLFREWTGSTDGHGRLLVTCRPEEAGLAGARQTGLRGLARPDSLWLLVRVLETAGVDLTDPRLARDKLNQLLDLLEDHPLSIELVGPHLKKLTPEEICADFAQLLAEFKVGAGKERNESLLASLAFSTRRLSPAAQAALPWLSLFTGGVFEQVLLAVSELDPKQWEAVRAELEATALVRVDHDIQLAKRPFLHFHPTLGYTAAGHAVPDPHQMRKRLVQAYYTVHITVSQALHGSNPRGGIEVLTREEANFRTAVRWAAADQQYNIAGRMGTTFGQYLHMSGRLRERDAWVAWLRSQVEVGGFSEAVVVYARQQAWTLFTQGQVGEAIRRLEGLIGRLLATTEFDPAFQLANTQLMLGRVLHRSSLSVRAIPVLKDAIRQWETLVEKASGEKWAILIERPGRKKARAELGNLSATLGDLANALMSAGQLDESLTTAERSMEIDRSLGHDHGIAIGLGQCASILMAQGRYAEADTRYDAALAAACRAGDKDLEGALLQHQGSLADALAQYPRAASLLQRALKLLQEMNNEGEIMRTGILLGVVEQNQGRLSEARTWYEQSREIAQRLGDVQSQAAAAQNIGIVCQKEGVAARKQGREAAALQRFEEAKQSLKEALCLRRQKGQPDEAASLCQLAQVHLLLGDLDEAERHAQRALDIWEKLDLKEVHHVYTVIADIAHARGDAAQAAEWERKRDAVLEELKRRSQGSGGLPPQVAQGIQALSTACALAATERAELDPQTEAALAQIEKLPAPVPDLVAFLRRLAAGDLPPVPAHLPDELRDFLTQLLDAVKEACKG